MSPDKTAKILQQAVDAAPLPGLAAAVIHRGETVFLRGFGLADAETGRPVEAQTRFPIASLTKGFTALQVCDLLARKEIAWDTPVRELMDFRLFDRDAQQHLSVNDLLCHRSGLPPHTWAWVYPGCDRETFVRERLPHLEASGSFRDGYRYSNLLYGVAGRLLEEQIGGRWEDQVDQITTSLRHLDATGCLDADWHRHPAMAQPTRNGRAIPPFFTYRGHPLGPAGEMYSSAEDLADWMRYLVDPMGAKDLFEPQVLISAERPTPLLGPLHYARGWRVEDFRGRRHAWHTGGCSGYSALLSLLPDEQSGIALLCNAHGVTAWLRAAACQVMDALLGEEAAEWPALLKAGHPQPAPPGPEPAGPARLQGHYANPGYGSLVFEAEEDRTAAVMNGTRCGWLVENNGETLLYLAQYGTQMAVQEQAGSLHIRFEPVLDPIRFDRRV